MKYEREAPVLPRRIGRDLEEVLEHYEYPTRKLNGRTNRFLDEGVAAVLAFLRSLTDARVEDEKAPFDHPSLAVPSSREVEEDGTTREGWLKAVQRTGGE